jgi:hypothetical protein
MIVLGKLSGNVFILQVRIYPDPVTLASGDFAKLSIHVPFKITRIR